MSKNNLPNKKKRNRGLVNTEPQVNINVAKNDPDNKEEKKTFFQRWFRWDRIGILATIISAIVGVITIWPPIGKAKHLNSINKSISTIENTIHPGNILISSLSNEDVHLIIKFQESVLSLVHSWEVVQNILPASEFKDADSKTLIAIIKANLESYNKFSFHTVSTIECISNIQNYGNLHNIDGLDPLSSSFFSMENKLDKFLRTYEERYSKVTDYTHQLAKKDGKTFITDEHKDEMYTVLKKETNSFKTLNELKFIDEMFKFLLEMNSKYMLYISSKQFSAKPY